ncbi:Asp-tRNA(Asn)/Glu-tRNA(Gln) amidotransferase subunit GatA [Candidatus Sneabacter namystus]|uniref:Glutamyl-tRNA(Gln) amidotransferase subunit A n=1 Tax=Candidatus Sneabacter namystus TaxID=2601646 RepID=A0A5C0UIG7_9RICK|nr:Asp-tRNA(Asn)/Glu-tRNA(Gln) amidotransferase subunit GatA [Candidatus Sneabacter namystus]QEK39577.1 Asp-tRNA(Asn)/Glu-tRNA(Gln) amidotransferase subunit GatA [Candidatus Sneabacter namystus]
MSSLCKLSISEALHGLNKGKFSSTELTKSHLDSIERNRHLSAYITETKEIALKHAQESDARRAKGETLALDGIPMSIKDNFCTSGVRTTCGSKMLEHFVPSYDSTVTTKLTQAGFICLGKANMDEFAMGSSNVTSYFGKVINPWSSDNVLVPGGSSGGSAVSVAANMAMASVGTDTGGSVRQPAAFTGIVGLKPSYGRVSRWGIMPFASSLDQAGVLARSVRDAALILSCIMGFDEKDATSTDIPVPHLLDEVDKNVKGLRVGIPRELMKFDLHSSVSHGWQVAMKVLEKEGVHFQDISLPYAQEALAVYAIVSFAEASSNLAMYDGVRYGYRTKEYKSFNDMVSKSRSEAFGDEVKRRILIGNYLLSAGFMDKYYLKARKMRDIICRAFEQIFTNVDAILFPTAPTPAFSVDDITDNPTDMYKNDIFTVFANLAGLPSISVPLLPDGKLPIGMQLMGKKYDEKVIIQLARSIERNVSVCSHK